jgi:PhzF family phenazine biosynthesis protein
MTIPIYQVDAFTDRAFTGNPAAVCILPAPAPEAWMQSVAGEMNLSETAYLVAAGSNTYSLRWFTPVTEVDLCGHATLASAHALWETGRVDRGTPVRFETRSGILTARLGPDTIELDFPAQPASDAPIPAGLGEALGAEVLATGRNKIDLLVELADPTTLRGLAPDMRRLAEVAPRGVIVTSTSDDPNYDFLSRFFAPAAGIDEDPVTGSAHCCLAPFWQTRLQRDRMTGFQASKRGGVVSVCVDGDRVMLGGQAVTVLVGTLIGPAATCLEQCG